MIRPAGPAAAALALALAACGGVAIKPDPVIPRALIEPLRADVGLIVASDMRNFTQEETRWGTDWKIDLGEGHLHMVQKVFKAAFRNVKEFQDLESARAASGLQALFEPRIEQYSFATARETGGRYYAVTVRYRINMYTPAGEPVDSFTLTGYGSSLAKGMSSGKPLELASVAAMRDAAARFLVQFPEQPAGQRLARGEAIVVEPKTTVAAASDAVGIEAVPIEEGAPAQASALSSQDASGTSSPAPPANPPNPSDSPADRPSTDAPPPSPQSEPPEPSPRPRSGPESAPPPQPKPPAAPQPGGAPPAPPPKR